MLMIKSYYKLHSSKYVSLMGFKLLADIYNIACYVGISFRYEPR